MYFFFGAIIGALLVACFSLYAAWKQAEHELDDMTTAAREAQWRCRQLENALYADVDDAFDFDISELFDE